MDISVIIPTYNRAGTIERAIRSVMEQTYPVSEIIVVDDGSVDDTEQVVLGINDNRIIYLKQKENKGNAAARNIGVQSARYDMISFQDSDDLWRPGKIKRQVEYYEDNRNSKLVYSSYVKHFSTYDMTVPDPNSDMKYEGELLPQLLFQNFISTQTILMEKQLLVDIGGFDENLRNLVDWDMVIRASKVTNIGFITDVLVELDNSKDAVTSNRNEYYRSRCYLLRKYREDYLVTGTFNDTVESIMVMAYQDGVLEQVKNMLLQYISS